MPISWGHKLACTHAQDKLILANLNKRCLYSMSSIGRFEGGQERALPFQTHLLPPPPIP